MYDYDDDWGSVKSPEQQEKVWKKNNRDVFKQGKWKKIEGQELTQADIGKRVKYLWFIEWETDTNDVDGILTRINPYPTESYYFVADVIGGTKDDPRYHLYNVYGQTMYVQESK